MLYLLAEIVYAAFVESQIAMIGVVFGHFWGKT
jgi:hypothetical protein